MVTERTAAIVGGGISGLSTAVALHQIGIEATVYERAPALTDVGAGISLWPNATRALRRPGVLDRLLETAGPIKALNVRDAQGRLFFRAPVSGYDAPSVCAYRPDLIGALRAALPAEALQTGKTLETVDALETINTGGDRAQLTFTDGTTANADFVVGADGIRSVVRTHVTGETADPVYRGYVVWRAIGPLPAAYTPGEITETWGHGARFGLLDVGGGRAYWYATANRPESETDTTPDARKAEILSLFGSWHDPIAEVIQETPASAILRGGTYDRPARRPWSRGRAVLVGDAFHPMTPNLGQGGCFAIEDALSLARALSESSTLPDAFSAFERARYRRAARVTRESLWTGRLGQLAGPLATLRDAATR
ncbi:MAG: FAD-dependent monooxygenase, partial [Bacteroidota bacterium]